MERQHAAGNAESSWSAPDGDETDVLNQILDTSAESTRGLDPYGDGSPEKEEMDGDALPYQTQAPANESGGYSPSAVPYAQQDRGYSPSAPVLPTAGYSPSNPVVSLPSEAGRSLNQNDRSQSLNQKEYVQASGDTSMKNVQSPVTASVSHTPVSTSGPAPGLTLNQAGSTPMQITPSTQTRAPATPVNPIPSTPYEAAQYRARQDKANHSAWIEYLTLAENTADLETIKDAYEEALTAFPNTVRPCRSLALAFTSLKADIECPGSHLTGCNSDRVPQSLPCPGVVPTCRGPLRSILATVPFRRALEVLSHLRASHQSEYHGAKGS